MTRRRFIADHNRPPNLEGTSTQIAALTAFVVEHRDLELLEASLRRFNVFDAVGVSSQELRHSDFLAFLLDPRNAHGLGDAFAKRLLQRALLTADGRGPVSPVDVALWSLVDLEVRREWRHVDLLLVDAAHHLVVAVENKIGSREHSGQLGRYRREVHAHFPPDQGWRPVFMFLTPDGDAPSDPAYVALDYAAVCDVVERLADERKPDLDQAVHVLMAHYGRMLRRYVVADAEVVDLCRRIYQRHRAAIDLIVQNRPDPQAELHGFLVELVASTEGLVPGTAPKQFVRFTLPEWDTPEVRVGTGWGPSSRIFQLEWRNYADSLFLTLVVAPGPKDVREKILAIPGERGHLGVFALGGNRNWGHLYNEQVLRPEHYLAEVPDALRGRIQTFWGDFLERTLPLLREGVTPVVESLGGSTPLGATSIPERANSGDDAPDETGATAFVNIGTEGVT